MPPPSHLAPVLLAMLATAGCARAPAPTAPPPPTPAAPAAACPPGPDATIPILQRSYRPALFGRGEDPSGGPDCRGVVNPERGFFAFRDLLAPTQLDELRASGVSLVYGRVLLAGHLDRPLSRALLVKLRAGFAAVRRAGLKVLPRFYYAEDASAADAPAARALEHIAALAPVLRENADVIAALHAGFVGAWGEWHPEDRASAADRRHILEALLAALPPSRMVLVRRPHFKQLAFGDSPVAPGQAFSGTTLSRLGHLNDCFLASANDFGTFRSPAEERYAASDSAYVAVGGETCAPNPPRSDCAAALPELARHHWSFLNRDYHADVLASWREGGCWETIACRLGYRFVVQGWSVPATVRAGARLPLSLALTNDGYARAFNPRPVLVALAPLAPAGNAPAARVHLLATGVDARAWAPGQPTAACLTVTVPAELPPGDYRVGLALPDPEPSLSRDPRYGVQLVGGVSFDPTAGINWLDAQVSITQ